MLKPSPGSKAKLSVCAKQCTSDEGVAGLNVLESRRDASAMHVKCKGRRRRGTAAERATRVNTRSQVSRSPKGGGGVM